MRNWRNENLIEKTNPRAAFCANRKIWGIMLENSRFCRIYGEKTGVAPVRDFADFGVHSHREHN